MKYISGIWHFTWGNKNWKSPNPLNRDTNWQTFILQQLVDTGVQLAMVISELKKGLFIVTLHAPFSGECGESRWCVPLRVMCWINDTHADIVRTICSPGTGTESHVRAEYVENQRTARSPLLKWDADLFQGITIAHLLQNRIVSTYFKMQFDIAAKPQSWT